MPWSILLLASLCLVAPIGQPAPDMDFDAIARGVADRTHDASCAAMEEWVAGHAGTPGAARALLWMARLRRMDERDDLAGPLLARALDVAKGTTWELPALKETADLEAAQRRFGRAIEIYDRLAGEQDAFWSTAGRLAAEDARAARGRWYLCCALLLALVALGGTRLALAARAGRRPWVIPREAIIAAPIAGLLLIQAHLQPLAEAHAVGALTLGGFALLWITGVSVRGQRLTVKRRLAEIALGACQSAALFFCALVGNGLWLKFLETLVMGAGE
jgi:hypothetical protein